MGGKSSKAAAKVSKRQTHPVRLCWRTRVSLYCRHCWHAVFAVSTVGFGVHTLPPPKKKNTAKGREGGVR